MSLGKQWNKQAEFGTAVDCLGAAIKGLVLYNILLLTGFWGYQDGKGAFHPFFYLLIVLLTVLFAYIYANWDGKTFVFLHIDALLVWCGLSWLAKSNQLAFILTGAVAAAESIIYKFIVGDTDAKRHIKRFKLQNYYKWGVLIWLISVVLYMQPTAPTPEHPLSINVCANYMTVSFIGYLILIVMMDYLFQQYDYFRQRQGTDRNTFRQIKHMNKIVAVLLSILIALSMLGANETIVRLASRIVQMVTDFLIGSGIWGLTKLTKSDYRDGAGMLFPSGDTRVDGNDPSIFSKRIFFVIGLIAVMILVPIILLKIYKNLMANYEIGEDKAEYIPTHEEHDIEYPYAKPSKRPGFANDNNGKIRKLYYKIMNARMDKNQMDAIQGKTPKELAGMYGKTVEHDAMQTLTGHYEKARYSNEPCTDDEVQVVKDIQHNSSGYNRQTEQG